MSPVSPGREAIRVWLPAPMLQGPLPEGIRADAWDGDPDLPGSGDEVEYIVLPLAPPPDLIQKLGKLPRLRAMQNLSAGVDHILPHVPGHITMCNAKGAHTATTAELTVALMIASLRELPYFAARQQEGRWRRKPSQPVVGRHVLIVGYGDIGAAVERRLAGWEVTVDRVARHARDGVHSLDELPALLKNADVVIILLPVTDETVGLVDAEFLRNMKDGALLVNTARGKIIDHDALLGALASGRVRAALDAHDPEPLPAGHPLWQAPNVILTPHVGGLVTDVRERSYAIVRENLARLAAGEPLQNVIDRSQGY